MGAKGLEPPEEARPGPSILPKEADAEARVWGPDGPCEVVGRVFTDGKGAWGGTVSSR